MISTDAASQVDRWLELPTTIEFPASIFKLDSGLTVIHQEISAPVGLAPIAQADVAATYPDTIQRFTPEKLQDLACRYPAPDRYVVTILKLP